MMRLATTSKSGQKIGGFCASTLLGLSFESSEKVFNAKIRYRMGAAHFFPKSILRRMTRPFSWGAKSSNLGEEGAQATRTKRDCSTLSKISHTAHANEYEILVCMGEMVPGEILCGMLLRNPVNEELLIARKRRNPRAFVRRLLYVRGKKINQRRQERKDEYRVIENKKTAAQ